MAAVDTLLTLLLENTRNVSARMAAAGFSEDEIPGAWNYARQAGYAEATGLGQDRLTERELAGLARSAVSGCRGFRRANTDPDGYFLASRWADHVVVMVPPPAQEHPVPTPPRRHFQNVLGPSVVVATRI